MNKITPMTAKPGDLVKFSAGFWDDSALYETIGFVVWNGFMEGNALTVYSSAVKRNVHCYWDEIEILQQEAT